MTKTLMNAYDALPIDRIKDRRAVSAAFLRLRIHDICAAPDNTYAIYHTGGMRLRVTCSPCLMRAKEPAARNMR
jgi:hypothetical protein